MKKKYKNFIGLLYITGVLCFAWPVVEMCRPLFIHRSEYLKM